MMAQMNQGAMTAEMTLALYEKVGRRDLEWLIEWESELFDYPCEAWKIEEYVHTFESEHELLEWYDDYADMEEAHDNLMIFEDSGLSQIIVFE